MSRQNSPAIATIAVDDLLIHAKIAGAVADEFIELFESAFVEKEVDTFAGGEFSFLVLASFTFFSTSRFGVGVAAVEFGQAIGHKKLGYRY